ncbi:MAG: DNA polymerase/3'-5' exonuclease PolX [Chloroflexi bacterium]|nr:DNA polymerase/3'-5' exonuclease PolX [Chloroflexota bacterium]
MSSTPPGRSRNGEVARLLEGIAGLLEVKGEQAFRVNAYRNAARRIEGLSEPIETVHTEGRLREIQGVGVALEQKLGEYLTTGSLRYYEALRAEFPPGLVELLEVPGLGPRKARLVFEQLGVGSLVELEAAAREHRLRDVPGLGERTEQNLLTEIDRLKRRTTRHQVEATLTIAEELLDRLRACPAVRRAVYAGSLRRMQDTIGDVDLLVAAERPEEVERCVLELPQVRDVLRQGPARTSILVRGGLQVDVRAVEPKSWGAALQYFTGSKAHNIRLREIAIKRGWKLNEYGLFDERTGTLVAGAEEDDVYDALGLQPIPPELREDTGEIELAAEGRLPRLLELSDIRGDLHLHSNWTDGGSSVEEMARAALALGREYIALTDHSKSLGVTNGLTEQRIAEQRLVIDEVNQALAPFRVLQGTEMDIKREGRLDYDDETLASLEYVSASIHSGMKQTREVMTERIARALRNRYVATLNHPHGRLIGSRAAYEVDMAAVIRVAVEHGVALEINSQPARMDLESIWARRGRDAGAKFAINTDAHATGQLGLMRFGVATARRAWLGPEHVLNAWPLADLLGHLAARRRIP